MGDVVVVGSINTDLVVRVERFPDPGETILGRRFDTYAGGKGANQAAAAARLGALVRMFGAVGDDAYSPERIEDLANAGVDVKHIISRTGVTGGIAIIQVEDSGQNQIVLVTGANGSIAPVDVDRVLPEIMNDGDWLCGQLEIPLDAMRRTLELARQRGVQSVVNTAPIIEGADQLLGLIDVLVVNEIEAGQLLGRGPVALDDAAEAGRELRARGPGIVYVTLGANGAVICDSDGSLEIPAPVVEVVDTTGAGDACVGAFVAALARGESTRAAAEYGVYAGSFAVQRPGAQPSQPNTKELAEFIERVRPG